MSGIGTNNLPLVTAIDELVGNKIVSSVATTSRITPSSLAEQIAALALPLNWAAGGMTATGGALFTGPIGQAMVNGVAVGRQDAPLEIQNDSGGGGHAFLSIVNTFIPGSDTATATFTGSMGASITATGSGTNLTVVVNSGYVYAGDALPTQTGVSAGTIILSQSSGPPGGSGVYVTNKVTTVSSASMTTTSSYIFVSVVASGVLATSNLVFGTNVPNGETLESFVVGTGTYGNTGLYGGASSAGPQYIAPEPMTQHAPPQEAGVAMFGYTAASRFMEMANINTVWANSNNNDTSGQAVMSLAVDGLVAGVFTERSIAHLYGNNSMSVLAGDNGGYYPLEPANWFHNYGNTALAGVLFVGSLAPAATPPAANDMAAFVGNVGGNVSVSLQNLSPGGLAATSLLLWDGGATPHHGELTYLGSTYSATYLTSGPANGARLVLNTNASGAPIDFGVGGTFVGGWSTAGQFLVGYTGAQGAAAGALIQVAGSIYASGVITTNSGSFTAKGGTVAAPSAGSGVFQGDTSHGATILGNGTPNDIVLYNKNAAGVLVVPTGTTNIQVTGSITQGSSFLAQSSVTLGNGAGSATATMTNAPVAGNPTKWAPVNDNGTTLYVALWA